MKRILIIMAFLGSVVGCCPKADAPVKKEIGVQLYSLRELIGNPEKYASNHVEVFQALAEYGYTSVEAANYNDGKFYGVEPGQFKADVEAAGLKVLSSHVNRGLSAEELASGDLTAALEWWKGCVAAHKAAGMEYMVVPHIGLPAKLADLQVYCRYLNEIGRICKDNGIKFGYHNHSHEFKKVEDNVMLDYMIENTDPELVFFQMDVYWAVYGHGAPVEYFKKYPGRFTMLHIKDHYEIGQSGMVGFDAIFDNAATAGLNDFIVEIEGFSTGDWRTSMKMCADYLLSAPFVKAAY
ncbi:MAG: sugar phosphate isomerase/epimerase family protein [Candidatus Cryptobacteroides sp.]